MTKEWKTIDEVLTGLIEEAAERAAEKIALKFAERDEQRIREEQRRLLEEKRYTPAQAASTLGVTKCTLWRWAKIGYLVPTKVGRSTFYKAADVLNLLEGNNCTSDNENAAGGVPTALSGRASV